MKTDIYACSKPLQYFNARNVPKSFHPDHKRVLVLITYFYKADEFYEMVKANDYSWDEVVKVPNLMHFYRYLLFHSFCNLIYGYDYSSILGLIHLIKRYNLYVLEEGTGTYLPYGGSGGRKNIIQSIVDGITGVSTDWGHTRFVKGAFVYYPSLYKKLRTPSFEPSLFEKPFVDKVSEDINLFLALSDVTDNGLLNISNSKILLYITDWEIKNDIINRIKQESSDYDYCVVKPHPHIKDYSFAEKIGLWVFKSNLMVEFLLSKWLKQGNKITVFHEGSTSIFYYKELVEAIDLSPNANCAYNKLIRGEF